MIVDAPSAGRPARPWGAEPRHHDAWPTRAQELLLKAALLRDERAIQAWREIRPRVQVASLDGATTALLPTLRRNLLDLAVEDELLGLFKGVHRHSWAHNQMLLAPMLPIVSGLERAGIPTLLLKGAAFVADGRLDAGMRTMNDVDVLVPTERTPAAVRCLVDAGLVPVGAVPPWYVTDYAPRFVPSHGFRDGLDRQLDLHWHVLHASCQPEADADFWQAAVSIELLGVPTRALCATDELLLVILHGLRWNALPTYRWVVDAAWLASGAVGAIDYDRLVEHGRHRRVSVALANGLSYLRATVDAPIPASVLKALRARRRSRIEALEFRAQLTQPRARGWLARNALYHEQYLRRHLPIGQRASPLRRAILESRRLAVRHPGDLLFVRSGGRPGPGRPASEMAAALGTGALGSGAEPVAVGQKISFGDPDTVRRYVAHGMWRSEPTGCWIAGREARLMLPLSRVPKAMLALEVSADALIAARRPHQRLEIRANGRSVARLTLDALGSLRCRPVVLPREVIAGQRTLDLTLRTPDATSTAELGIGDDDRRLGVFLRELRLLEPPVCAVDAPVDLTSAAPRALPITGWYAAEALGRWTRGQTAELLLRVNAPRPALDLRFDVVPFLGRGSQPLRVELRAGGRSVARLRYREACPQLHRVRLPAAAFGPDGDLLLQWRIFNPSSPQDHGISDDQRQLGLYFRSITLTERA